MYKSPLETMEFILRSRMELEQYKLVGRKVADKRQKNDFYPTPRWVAQDLLEHCSFSGRIWECACGDGRLSQVLESAGYDVFSSDLNDYGFGQSRIDFLLETQRFVQNHQIDNIVTNPPFNLALPFIKQGLLLSRKKLALLLPVHYLCGLGRSRIYRQEPPDQVIVLPSKVDFVGSGNPVMEFAWFVWDKESKKETRLKWAFKD